MPKHKDDTDKTTIKRSISKTRLSYWNNWHLLTEETSKRVLVHINQSRKTTRELNTVSNEYSLMVLKGTNGVIW